jgi:hypothetical protein
MNLTTFLSHRLQRIFVSSQFKFDLVENFSTIVPYNCPPNDPTVSMLITALRTPNLSDYDKVTVEDILNKTTYSEGDLVTVLVVVAAVCSFSPTHYFRNPL